MDDFKSRPEECRDTCQVMQCEGSGCRFLHDEARVPPNTDGTLIVEVPFTKEELRSRRARRNT